MRVQLLPPSYSTNYFRLLANSIKNYDTSNLAYCVVFEDDVFSDGAGKQNKIEFKSSMIAETALTRVVTGIRETVPRGGCGIFLTR